MNELPSAQFRTQYAKLTEPTIITVNGHPIGAWVPTSTEIVDGWRITKPPNLQAAAQAQRDELLHKINRGK